MAILPSDQISIVYLTDHYSVTHTCELITD